MVGESKSNEPVETNKEHATTTSKPQKSRVRVLLTHGRESEEGITSRRIKAGSFVEDHEKKDFGLANIRGTTVPDRLGSDIPLDDDTMVEIDGNVGGEADVEKNIGDSQRSSSMDDTTGEFFPPDDSKNDDSFSVDLSASKIDRDGKSFYTSKQCKIGLLVFTGLVLSVVLGVMAGILNDNPGALFRPNENGSTLPSRAQLKKKVQLSTLADITDPLLVKDDRPMLLLVQQTNGKVIWTILQRCFGLKIETEFNKNNPDNIDAVVSHMLFKAASTFKGSDHHGRMFTVLRDPLERTVDMFQKNKAEGKFNMNEDSTLKDYLVNQFTDNWLTRVLTNEYVEQLTMDHVKLANTVLREKCVVGMTTDLEDSFNRFAQYFQWDMLNVEHQQCAQSALKHSNEAKYIDTDENDTDEVTLPEKGTDDYDLLRTRNHMDLLVFDYAKQLYESQKESLFKSMYSS